MKYFIAYFDLLGYKEFILRNDIKDLHGRIEHILRDMEMAIGVNAGWKTSKEGYVFPDISQSKILCLNISDTIIFWTKDNSWDSFKELIAVVDRFNWQIIKINFPVRGIVVYDEMAIETRLYRNEQGGMYNVNCIYGKGLVNAHIKSNNQNWAGCVIDNSVIEELKQYNYEPVLNEVAVKYKVPYQKKPKNQQSEYVLRLTKGTLNEVAFKNLKRDIIESFKRDKKSIDHPKVKAKLNNTIKYIEYFREARNKENWFLKIFRSIFSENP